MANTVNVPKAHLILGICIPLAVLLGYLLAEPLDAGSLAVVVLVIFALSVPLLLKWHHQMLVVCWNLCVSPAFIPGQPPMWLVLSFGSLLFAVLARAVNPNCRFTNIPSLTWPLAGFAVVVLVTAIITGGVGLHSLGSSKVGGKGYYYIFGAIAGYFAMTAAHIPLHRADAYTSMFFLSGLTGVASNLIYLAGPSFYFLYYLFPITVALEQAGADINGSDYVVRFNGLMMTAAALYSFLLARFGLRGILQLGRPVRLGLFVLAILTCLESGFRSVLILFVLVVAIVFVLEGLHRTRAAAVLAGLTILSAAICIGWSNRLPGVVQRTLSFLPVEIDPAIRQAAESSSQWRVEMWKVIVPEIPNYLLCGKGYALDPTELDMAALADATHQEVYSVGSLLSGAYHNGGLSVLIPFGLAGLLGFLWFLGASLRYLHVHYSKGNPALRRINTVLYAIFAAKAIFFFAVFGALYTDLFAFTGLIGLAVALNGPIGSQASEDAETERLVPAFTSRAMIFRSPRPL